MIPTAEELFNKEHPKGDMVTVSDAEKIAIKLAKLHVEAALKAAIQQLDNEGANHVRESILNAYPLTNIK